VFNLYSLCHAREILWIDQQSNRFSVLETVNYLKTFFFLYAGFASELFSPFQQFIY